MAGGDVDRALPAGETMKICLIGTLPERDRFAYRGPERTTIGLAEALADRGHEVVVVADEGDPVTVGVEARVLGDELTPGINRVVRFYRRIRERVDLDGFDVVHSWRAAPGVDVYSAHQVGSVATVEQRRPGTFDLRWRLGARLKERVRRRVARRAQRVTVTTTQNAIAAVEHGIRPDRTVPVGVDQSFLQADVESRGVTVLCVGRVEPRKNQRFVAAHTPNDMDLRLIGPVSDEGYASQIRSVELEGGLSPTALRRAYREADVFVLPSVFEGFGLTAVEAMAAGTPVVVADSCGIADHVQREAIGRVYPFDDPAGYERALRDVVADRETMGATAREYVDEHLTWSVIAEQFGQEYRRVVRPDRSAASVTVSSPVKQDTGGY